jgi:hypothetical protein
MRTIVRYLALLLVVAGCSERMPPPSGSPDGKLNLAVSRPQDPGDREYGCLVFDIRDSATGKILCHKNTGARARGFTISWPANDEVDIYCSDIGTQHWKRQADGTWKKE